MKIPDIDEVEDVGWEIDLVIKIKFLDMFTSSRNYPHPEILNSLYRFFHKSPYVMRHAQDFISKYFFLHFGEKGCHREQLMLIILNSMREVSDGSLFNNFDKNNALDIRSV